MTKMNITTRNNSAFRPDLFASKAEEALAGGNLPPVELWDPEYCGEIDMRICRDGSWHYMGSLINRERMVKLFSTVLRCDDGNFFLVTPVEKVGIQVDDAPFLAVEMERKDDHIIFRTNMDDYVRVDEDHPIKVIKNKKTGEPSPYVRVRGHLDALMTRSVYYLLADHAEEHDSQLGVWSGGTFFPLD